MSVDPYHVVQQEIQASLQAASQLQSSFLRISNMAREDSEELMWAKNELKATLAALEADLEDLEESVKIVESTDARTFGLDNAEVQKRRNYVSHVRNEIQNMRAIVSTPQRKPTIANAHGANATPLNHPLASPSTEREDSQSEWAREEQQIMLREQDHTMDSIAGTLNTLAQQAGLMGQEIAEHTEMLDDLEQNVDRTDTKLSDGMRRLRKFIRDSEEKGSSWCIGILMVILMALLLAVILV